MAKINYKKEVLKTLVDARCYKYDYKKINPNSKPQFIVKSITQEYSDCKLSAQAAWKDAWKKHCS